MRLTMIENFKNRFGRLSLFMALFVGLHATAFGDLIFSGTAVGSATGADGFTLLNDGSLVLVVVDKSGDGFSAAVDFGLSEGDPLDVFVGNADDVIIGFNEVDDVGLPGIIANVPGTASFALGGGLDPGDQFGVFVFDGLASGSTSVSNSAVRYGFFTDFAWVVPAADGSTTLFGSGIGEFPNSGNLSTTFSVAPVPEPGSLVLGGIFVLWSVGIRTRRC